MYLNQDDFIKIVKNTPLVAIDICIIYENKILLGKRNNSPARNFYFVPGGRILKGEKINSALKRILKIETGYVIENIRKENIRHLGVYEHFYDDNFLGNNDFSTHYIISAYIIRLEDKKAFNQLKVDKQHSDFIWFESNMKSYKNIQIHPYATKYIEDINLN